jgi:hypothetical protein
MSFATTRVDSGQRLSDHVDDERSLLELFQSGTPIERPGMRAHMRWDGTDRTVSVMGASGRHLEDGYPHLYRQDDDEPDDAVYDPDFEPYTIIAIAQIESRCNHHPDTWERFAAKAGLGLIELIRTGHAEASLDKMASADHQAQILAGLRALAMPSTPPPSQPSGCLARIRDGDPQLQHQVALVDDDDAVVVWVLLFGNYLMDRLVPFGREGRRALPVPVSKPAN